MVLKKLQEQKKLFKFRYCGYDNFDDALKNYCCPIENNLELKKLEMLFAIKKVLPRCRKVRICQWCYEKKYKPELHILKRQAMENNWYSTSLNVRMAHIPLKKQSEFKYKLHRILTRINGFVGRITKTEQAEGGLLHLHIIIFTKNQPELEIIQSRVFKLMVKLTKLTRKDIDDDVWLTQSHEYSLDYLYKIYSHPNNHVAPWWASRRFLSKTRLISEIVKKGTQDYQEIMGQKNETKTIYNNVGVDHCDGRWHPELVVLP